MDELKSISNAVAENAKLMVKINKPNKYVDEPAFILVIKL